jgi:cyclase
MDEIAPGIFVETRYRGANIGAIRTHEGYICIDAPPYPGDAREWRAALAARGPDRLRYIINLDHHRDRVVGSSWLGAPVIAHEYTADKLRSYGHSFPQPIIDALASRRPDAAAGLSGARVVVPQITLSEQLKFVRGTREILVLHRPGPTPGALWVHVPDAGVVFTGDSVVLGTHPWLAEANSGAWLASLAELKRVRFRAEIVVPGRGPVGGKSAAEPVMAYLRLVRTRVRRLQRSRRARTETSELVAELLRQFPINNESRERVQRRIKAGLDHVYDEFASGGDSAGSN